METGLKGNWQLVNAKYLNTKDEKSILDTLFQQDAIENNSYEDKVSDVTHASNVQSFVANQLA